MPNIEMTKEEFKRKFGYDAPSGSKIPVSMITGAKSTTSPQETSKKMPILTNERGGFGSALKDVTVGAGKSFISGGRSLAGGVQWIGQKVLGTDIGIDSISNMTETGKRVAKQLESKSRAEQVGGVLGTVGELATGFTAAKAPQMINKARTAYKAGQELKQTEKILESVTPDVKDISKPEYKKLLMQGKIQEETLKNPAKYVLSDIERKIAMKNRSLINKSSIKTADNIVGAISKKDTEVGKFLEANNGIYNKGELKNHIVNYMKDVDDITIDPSRIQALKNTMADNFLNSVKKNDIKSLWEARKAFDAAIDKAFTGSPTLQKTIKREFRNAVQDYIAKRTPDNMYKSKMKEMSELYDLFDVVSDKAASQKGRSAIGQWIRNNPKKAKFVQWAVPVGVGGGLVNSLLGE
jgi:hypothetical protein